MTTAKKHVKTPGTSRRATSREYMREGLIIKVGSEKAKASREKAKEEEGPPPSKRKEDREPERGFSPAA